MEAGSITEETAQAFVPPTLYQALGSREEVSVGRRWLGRFSDEVIIKGMANTGLPSISAWCAEGQAVWRFVSPLPRGSGNLHAKPLHGGVGMIWDVASGIGRLGMQLKWRDRARRSPVNAPRSAWSWTETGRVSDCCCPAWGGAGGGAGLVLRAVVSSTVTAQGVRDWL